MLRRGGYSKDFLHRFGLHKNLPFPAEGKKRIWIQAVSVGEIEALGAMLKKLSEDPRIQIVITTTTSTGYKILREKYAGYCEYVGIFPFDFMPFSTAAWNRIKPNLCVSMEGELWPEHLHQASSRGIPALLINARLSDKSFSRYKKFPSIAKRLFGKFAKISASSEPNFSRIKALGAENVVCSGNLKFDSAISETISENERNSLKKEIGFDGGSFVLLGSSTWGGEEEMLLKALKKIRSKGKDCRLLLVPRHAERRGEIKEILSESGLPYCVRSESKSAPSGTMVYLADTTGELRMFTQIADLAFVGKSLPPNDGGQTPIECAALGKPMVYGNRMTNFRAACSTLESERASVKVNSHDEAVEKLCELAFDENSRNRLSENAKKWHSANVGATDRTIEIITASLFKK